METPTIEMSVGQFVTARPSRSRVFQRLGIDFCCGGTLSLAEACKRRGLDASQTLDMLLIEDAVAPEQANPATMSLADLCDHIESTHHAYLRTELPRLSGMVRKVTAVHGERHPWLAEMAAIFERFATQMGVHMMKEEVILFPALRKLERAARGGLMTGSLDAIAAPIRVMESEHDGAGDDMSRMKTLSNGFIPPADACTTFRAMLDGLRELEEDLHMHVHKENNVLFPRALALAGHADQRAARYLAAEARNRDTI
jgi:regulator of cell morphogenesis and NO signaling